MSSPPPPRPLPPPPSIFRAPVVSGFSSRAAASWKVRALHIGSYAAALGVAFVMVGLETYEVGASGRHALSGVQEVLRDAYEWGLGVPPEATAAAGVATAATPFAASVSARTAQQAPSDAPPSWPRHR